MVDIVWFKLMGFNVFVWVGNFFLYVGFILIFLGVYINIFVVKICKY